MLIRLQTLSLLCITLVFISACGVASEPSSIDSLGASTGVALKLSKNLATATTSGLAKEDKKDEPSYTIPTIKLNESMFALKDNQIKLVSAETLESLKKEGYLIENEQEVYGFSSANDMQNALLQLERSWALASAKGVTIAIIDSGVNATNASLQHSQITGYDFIDDSASVKDEHGHGTSVAALIAGKGRINGIAPEANILSLRVLDENNRGSSLDVIRAIYYAADLLPGLKNETKADIINLSLGHFAYSPSMHEAIKAVREAGVLVVAAAGNSFSEVSFPAKLPEVIAVGAAEVNEGQWGLAHYSNFGAELDVLVPLGGSTNFNKGSYKLPSIESVGLDEVHFVTSTSFAAPYVSGLAALLMSQGFNADEAVAVLRLSSADIYESGQDDRSGFGLLSPYAAVRSVYQQRQLDKPFVVQVLDARSLQEHTLFQVGQESFLSLDAGIYKLVVWEDTNNDSLWQQDVEVLSSYVFELVEGELLDLSLVLQ